MAKAKDASADGGKHYEVRLKPDGRSLEWVELTATGQLRHDTEPGTSWAKRTGGEMMSILPIEWLL